MNRAADGLPCRPVEECTPTTPTPNPYARPRPGTNHRTWWYFFVGIGAVGVGLLPWLATGLRLPLQNLWAIDTLPEDMPRVLLPFSQYFLAQILSMVILGLGVAGLAVRAAPPAARGKASAYAGIGAFAAIACAAIQTATVVRAGLGATMAANIYFGGVLVVIALGVVLGLAALFLVARAGRPGALVGLTLAALSAELWLYAVTMVLGAGAASPVVPAVLAVARWLPAILAAAALAWCGVGTARQAVAWAVSLLLLWLVPALLDGLSYAAGSRVFAGNLQEMASAGASVVLGSLGGPGALLPAVLALAVGIAGVFAVRVPRAAASTGTQGG